MRKSICKDDATPREAMQGLAAFFTRDNGQRQYQALGYQTPAPGISVRTSNSLSELSLFVILTMGSSIGYASFNLLAGYDA